MKLPPLPRLHREHRLVARLEPRHDDHVDPKLLRELLDPASLLVRDRRPVDHRVNHCLKKAVSASAASGCLALPEAVSHGSDRVPTQKAFAGQVSTYPSTAAALLASLGWVAPKGPF